MNKRRQNGKHQQKNKYLKKLQKKILTRHNEGRKGEGNRKQEEEGEKSEESNKAK